MGQIFVVRFNLQDVLQVQKSASHYTEADEDEVTVLNQIRVGDPNNQKCCLRLHDSFVHSGPNGEHMCMLLEVWTFASRFAPVLKHIFAGSGSQHLEGCCCLECRLVKPVCWIDDCHGFNRSLTTAY